MRLLRFIIVLFIAAAPLACATAPQTAANSPERAVEDTFLAYQKALLAEDGTTAAGLVTAASWDYYREMADEALTADRNRLEELDFVDRLTALLFRMSLTRDALRRMSGEELVAYSVDQGWISREKTANMKLANFRITGDSAKASVIGRDGKPSTVTMGFETERGAWRLDLLDTINTSRRAMPLAIALSGMTEAEFIFASLKRSTGRTPESDIWSPPS